MISGRKGKKSPLLHQSNTYDIHRNSELQRHSWNILRVLKEGGVGEETKSQIMQVILCQIIKVPVQKILGRRCTSRMHGEISMLSHEVLHFPIIISLVRSSCPYKLSPENPKASVN